MDELVSWESLPKRGFGVCISQNLREQGSEQAVGFGSPATGVPRDHLTQLKTFVFSL